MLAYTRLCAALFRMLCMLISAAAVSAILMHAEKAEAGRHASYSRPSYSRIVQHDGSVGIKKTVRETDSHPADQKKSTVLQMSEKTQREKGLHGKIWGFESSMGSTASHRQGMDGKTLKNRAIQGKIKAASRESAGREHKIGKDQTDNGVRLSFDSNGQRWKSSRDLGTAEDIPLESQHRVRALAGVKDKNLEFGLGPEVILKDSQQVRENVGKTDQPDVQLGFGMQMGINF